MTKKSLARLERDAKKKEQNLIEKALRETQESLPASNCWDDIKSIHDNCLNVLRSHVPILQILTQTDIITKMDQPAESAKYVQILSRDLETMMNELNNIAASYEGKSGGPTDAQDLMESFKIYEKYIHWTETHEGLIIPSVLYLTEQIGIVEQKIQDTKGLTSEQDPAVITDVTFSEAEPDKTI